MARSFLELLSYLRDASSTKAKRLITDEISDSLQEDDRHVDYFLYSMFRGMISNRVSKNFAEITDSEFYRVSVKSYIDDDFKCKVAVSMSYLQDFEKPDNNLDNTIINYIHEELKKQNLEFLVNDISVNVLQLRNGIISNYTKIKGG